MLKFFDKINVYQVTHFFHNLKILQYLFPVDKDDSTLSIFAQLPQNICMGLAEIFATVASLEYAYLAAPRSAQALLMSLQFCSLGISSAIGKVYLSLYSTTTGIFDFSVSKMNRTSQCDQSLFDF